MPSAVRQTMSGGRGGGGYFNKWTSLLHQIYVGAMAQIFDFDKAMGIGSSVLNTGTWSLPPMFFRRLMK